MGLVKVVAIDGVKRAERRFLRREVGEAFAAALKVRRPSFETHVVQLTEHLPPPDNHVATPEDPSRWWCPFCADARAFVRSTILNVLVCRVCGVSERHHFVKLHNGLR